MAKKTSPNNITSLTDDWANDAANGLPFSGQAVQDFIKKQFGSKVGTWCWSPTVDASNFYHIWGFATEADKQAYLADPDGNASLLLANEALPISTVQGDSYGAYLFTDAGVATDYVVSGDKMTVNLRFSAVRNSSGDRLNVGVPGTLVIQRKTASSDWTTVETRKDVLTSTDYADTTAYTSVDIGSALKSGAQQIRIRAYYTYEADDGSQKTATSTYVSIGGSITKTTLDLECQQNWQTPILASVYAERGFPISYMVYGAVPKTLHVEITGGNGKALAADYPLSADQDSATVSKSITDATDTYKLFKHGVRTVKAWLTCDDGMGGTISSRVLVNRFMVVNPTAAADKTTPYLLLQNMVGTADNFAQADLCQYSVYSPGADGTTNNGSDVTVIFYLTAYAENFPADNPEQYFRIESTASPGTRYTLNTTIEIETEDEEQATIPAYFRVWRKDGDSEVNFLQSSIGQGNIVIQVDNSESYAPKAGADFVLNPKNRNNSEANPKTIVNAKTGKTVDSTWTGFGLVKDGWVTSDVDGQRVLRVPAGAKLNFKYNPFSQFLTTPDSALEIELDFMVRNVTDEDSPIISLFENFSAQDADGNTTTQFRGLKIQPIHGEIHTKSNYVSSETDFAWKEGERTHVCINIHNAVAPNKGDALVPASSSYDTSATKIALVRIFIGGEIRREFKYSITDAAEFCTGAMSNGGFTIGQDGADIDIYSIRIYQNTALEASDILANHISTLPTTEEKRAMRQANDILTGGKVDLEKCRALGKRCLVWHGTEPYKENTSTQRGYWEVFQYDARGNYLPEYSGTLCKSSAALETKRQGSTANTYYYSNIQTKMSDVTETITVPLSELHSSITYEVKTVQGEDGTESKVVGLKGGCLGKNFPTAETAVDYAYAEVDGAPAVVVPDGWVDGNGKYRGVGYIVAEGTPMAQKLVNKINYASSMQSHLTGVNNLYNDLHKAIVGKNSLQEAYPEARVSKYTEPFLYFTQALDSDTPVYRGPCTFGAGKMDKPTWGYVKKLHPMFTMIEGSDNNYELTDMRVPFTWGDASCPEAITYSADDEGFFYNGKQCLDFDAGKTDDDGTPGQKLITAIQGTWNFLYLHSPFVKYYKGTFDAFQKSDAAKDTFAKYWCTDGSEAYRLKRYDFANNRWVDAGLWDSTAKAWKVIDLRTDEITASTYQSSANQSEYAELNKELCGAIVAHAKKYLGFYFRIDSLKLYYSLIIHLLAGTDSCSKNTYYVLDPKPVEVTIEGETRTCYLFELHTDDVDTMMLIDNNGRFTKPYYIDRMHPYVDGDTTTEKYEGMHNVLFTLCEDMWEGTKELQGMVKQIFTAMEKQPSESDYIEGMPTTISKASVYGCLWKYVYYVHKYIPQMAFNEAARIRYEYPEMIGFVSYGSGARGVRPITQSNGSLLEAELQFIERRLVLMSSYAAWGPFADGKTGNLGISDVSESFSMQAFHTPDTASSQNDYAFTVKPHQYLYPTGMLGQTVIDPHVRVAPGESYRLELGSTTSNDTGMSVSGINYYRSIGNVGDLSTTPANTITVNGKRLTEFVAEPSKTYTDSTTGKPTPAFRPGAIVISAKNISNLSLRGCSATSGAIDLTQLSRLKTVDVRQTKLSDVTLPASHVLSSALLPATISSVDVENQENLSVLQLEGYGNLTRFVVKNNKLVDTFAQATALLAAKPSGLKTVTLTDLAWNTQGRQCNMDLLMYLASLKANLTGIIFMLAATSDRALSLADKEMLCALYGNIDSTVNALYIKYDVRAINSISISGEAFMTTAGKDYRFSVVPSPVTGNNVAIKDGRLDIAWSIADTADSYAHWADSDGLLHVDKLSDPALDLKHTMTVKAVTTNGTLTAQKKVGFYRHIPVVGDFAYADGTFDGEWDEERTFIGLVFMRLPIYTGSKITAYDVRVVAAEDLKMVSGGDNPITWTTHRWGLYPDDLNGWLSEEANIEKASGVKDAFDIDELKNFSSRWGGANDYDGGYHTVPSWATDTVLANTPTKTYATYKATWDAYYTALDALYAAIQAANPSYSYSADNRKKDDKLYTIAEGGTILAANKDTMTQAWVRARSCYSEFTSAASSNGLSSSGEYTAFAAAYQSVSDMLNNGESYTATSEETKGPSWCQGFNYYYLDDITYLDDSQTDGYKVLPSTCAAGDYNGKDYTAKIVTHARKVINGYLSESYPTTLQELADAMAALRNANASVTNPWRYEEFYYPAAYGCYLYEPTADTLNAAWQKGNWYLPSEGELTRLYNFYRLGQDIENAADGATEARTPIFANANKRAAKTVFKMGNYWVVWSSAEGGRGGSWVVGFPSGGVFGWYGKSDGGSVRPCSAFIFTL